MGIHAGIRGRADKSRVDAEQLVQEGRPDLQWPMMKTGSVMSLTEAALLKTRTVAG